MSSKTRIPSVPNLIYDVFLSSRGTDTGRSFTHHLYSALTERAILTFRDDEELESGESIGPNISQAIERSTYAVVVFSQNYADSPRCLDEIAKITDCMKDVGLIVLPVFYDVAPSDVRRQAGHHFGEAFAKHQQRFQGNPNKVQRWRDALFQVGYLSGWDLQDGYESGVIQEIAEKISTGSRPLYPFLFDCLAGMDSHLNQMLSYLDIGCPDIRIIGIFGMGGIGKTTIAKAVFGRVSYQFEASCFMVNVREVAHKHGLAHLQQLLLSLLGTELHVQTIAMGKDLIRCRLRRKRVFLVFDDVDQKSQLEVLCDRTWFGPGSRIIITTRDQHLLSEADKVYKVNPLTADEALQLLSLNAFGKSFPPKDYEDLCVHTLRYAQGLPLAIVVLGAYLYGKKTEEWAMVIDRLKKSPSQNIIAVFKISYDGLDETEKATFLDIACFFKGEDRDRVARILSEGERSFLVGLEVLIQKSLVTVVGRKLWMHNLIQQVGQQIVRDESPRIPGRRSRLWDPPEIIHVLNSDEGSGALEGIVLDMHKTKEVKCSSEAFSKMYGLRILQIRNVHMKEGPRYLSDTLTCLEWSGYPAESLPQNFTPGRLRELNLCHSNIKQLWTGTKNMSNLTDINLSNSLKLSRTPDFTFAPRLERLTISGCPSLVEIDSSVAFLKMLTCLNLKDCRSLESLPSQIEMNSLQILILSGCSKLKKIPDFVGSMECLLELCLDKTAVEQLPISVGLLTGLSLLNLRDCKNLKSLPSEIGNLISLKRLNICGCSKLETLPESLGKIDCLEELDASGTSISTLPSSISLLANLKVLSLGGCKGMPDKMGYPLSFRLPITDSGGLCSLTELDLSDCNLQEGTIPNDLGFLSSLLSLNLSKNSFVSLPKSIRQLSKLQNLNLESCKSLQNLPELSSKMNCSIGAEGGEKRLSSCFNLVSCFKLVVNQRCTNIALAMLRRFLQGISYAESSFEAIIPGNEISDLFSDHGVGPVVSMELPQQRNKMWMGYAFCVCFVIRRDLPVPANRLGKWKFRNHSTAHGLRCEMKTKADWCPSFACSQELGKIESEHLWIFFVSSDYFGTAWQETSHNIEFTFKPSGTGMEVKKCGGRLIYEQDLGLIGRRR